MIDPLSILMGWLVFCLLFNIYYLNKMARTWKKKMEQWDEFLEELQYERQLL